MVVKRKHSPPMFTTVPDRVATFAVAIVNYNTREHLQTCLASVQREAPAEVVVVDNGSTDGSIDMVRTKYPQITLLTNQTNPGYGAAANQAVTACSAEYVLLLNSDTRLQLGTLCALSNYLDQHPRAAIVGPRLLNPDGTLQVSCFHFPTPLHTFLKESSVRRLFGSLPGLREKYLPAWRHSSSRAVPWVLGAALAIRRKVFAAVGGFDPSFFMYFEEVDLCYRTQEVGWQVHFAPVTDVVHVGGASTSRHRAAMTEQLYHSLFHFYRQHFSAWQTQQLRLVVAYIVLRNLVRDTVRLLRQNSVTRYSHLIEDLQVWWRILRRL